MQKTKSSFSTNIVNAIIANLAALFEFAIGLFVPIFGTQQRNTRLDYCSHFSAKPGSKKICVFWVTYQ